MSAPARHLTTAGIEIRYAMQAVQAAICNGVSEIIVAGPRGTGKTVFLCDLFHRMAMKYPGMTQLWLRSTRSRLTDAVLKTFEEEILGPNHPLSRSSSREHRHRYTYPNGSKIILQGLDDPERQRSVAADIVWVNEPTEISEDTWEEIGASLRETLGSTCPFRVKIGDHNPAPPGHWTNKRCKPFPVELYPRVRDDGLRMREWFTPAMYQATQEYNFGDQTGVDAHGKPFKTFKVQTFHADNPHYWDVDAWDWKPAGREYVINQLGKMSGPRKARYLEGRPAAAEGVVFIEFDPERHIYPPGAFGDGRGIPSHWPLFLAEDPGYDHATAIAIATVTPNGRVIIIAEYVKRQATNTQDAKWITDFERASAAIIRKKLGDPHYMFSRTKHNSGETIAQQMSKLGHRFNPAPAATNGADLSAQVEMMRTALITNMGDGRPGLMLLNTCPAIANAFQSWSYKRNAKGEMTGGEDKFEEAYKDEMDAVRMIVASNPQHRYGGVKIYNTEENR